jgi:hypothetical protein
MLTILEYFMLGAEGMLGHPQAYGFTYLGYFSVWCSFILCEKTSTQKLSHSFSAG